MNNNTQNIILYYMFVLSSYFNNLNNQNILRKKLDISVFKGLINRYSRILRQMMDQTQYRGHP